MDDVTSVKVSEPAEDLTCKIGELGFLGDMFPLEGASVHELEKHLDFGVVVEHVVALDDVWVVDVAEDLDLPADLAADRVFVVAVDDLEGVDTTRGPVDHLVDGTA